MSAHKILLAARSCFAKEGYEGASLQKIAEEVGIKKPSIYAHYKGKEDLFLHVMKLVFATEKRRIIDYYIRNQQVRFELRMNHFFHWMLQEYELNDNARFLIRMGYYPPAGLYDQVMDILIPFLDGLRRALTRLLERERMAGGVSCKDPREAALAFLTIVEGALMELVCGRRDRYLGRVEAVWPIYWQGMNTQ
ncbi:TetR/AcrR family transcriptional regulator [Paenibacillus sp. GCM10012307]|uniref:TetR/AcrR family transcriptional regulator n=1 Tax=Paenibacillus roseus TaxID=2798579 RepID=A0A934J3N2_9BACL|nr:TetR/AcrR family transcriptional regulator [Paenibacillus roseus]MBJ6362684.1 TetR/AcrR family transcriptional regulator [Paenibacillus roseus]